MAAIGLPYVVGEVVVLVDDVSVEEIEVEDLASFPRLRGPAVPAPGREERTKGLDAVLRHRERSIARPKAGDGDRRNRPDVKRSPPAVPSVAHGNICSHEITGGGRNG